MIAALFATLALAAAPQDAAELTPASILAHPAIARGDFDAYVEHLLAGLEAAPDHPLAGDAAAELSASAWAARPALDLDRLEALIERVPDARASLALRQRFLREVRRQRFREDARAVDQDLFGEFLGGFHVFGPVGPLAMRAPLIEPPGEDDPEHGLRARHVTSAGDERAWVPLERPRNERVVAIGGATQPAGLGAACLATLVRGPEGPAELEVFCSSRFTATWNGFGVADVRRRTPAEREVRFRIPVVLDDGWNALVLRVPSSPSTWVAARFVDRDGRVLEVEEAAWPDGVPPAATTEPTDPRGLALAPEELPDGPFRAALEVRRHLRNQRVDRALAVAEPAAAEAVPVWLRLRAAAWERADHVPAEVRRRERLEALERAQLLGHVDPRIDAEEVRRLGREDRVDEAVSLAERLVARAPDSVPAHLALVTALDRLDASGALGERVLGELLASRPDASNAWILLARTARDWGEHALARERLERALRADGENLDALQEYCELSRTDPDHAREALERVERVLADEPGDALARELRLDLWGCLDESDRVRATLEDTAARFPYATQPRSALAQLHALEGDDEAARAALAEVLAIEPAHPGARELLEHLGGVDPAEAFFERFGLESWREAAGSSTVLEGEPQALALDEGLVYVFPDGSFQYRTHEVALALDRRGTELLHTRPAAGRTPLVRVLQLDGGSIDPPLVDGSWVMPSLDPGDAVEVMEERLVRTVPGQAPELGTWRFASFARPFVVSRFCVYLPDGVPGSWVTSQFAGPHDVYAWEGGRVHVFVTRDSARRPEEPLRPSDEECLPWVAYGEDVDPRFVVAEWREILAIQSSLPEGVRDEVRAWVRAHDPGGPDTHARARALYEAVVAHAVEFGDFTSPSEVWYARRGNPLGLLAAVYDLAGVPFEWAIFHPPVAPELDPGPLRPFDRIESYTSPTLRLPPAEPGGSPVWVLVPEARGIPFGRLPAELLGAEVLVLGADEPRTEVLERTALASLWDRDVELRALLRADGSAEVRGRLATNTTSAAILAEQLSRLEPAQLDSVGRNMAGSAMPGLDVRSWEFVELGDGSGDFEIAFEGVVPAFVTENGRGATFHPRIAPTRLAESLGPASRAWPLALRASTRTRVRLVVDGGDAWRWADEHRSHVVERDGMRISLRTEPDGDANAIELFTLVRGPLVRAPDVPALFDEVRRLDQEVDRPIALERAD